jgi:hypothetical protein
MTSLGDEYRAKAHEAQAMELEAQNQFMRKVYGKIAGHWLELAERMEREELAGAVASALSSAPAGNGTN